MLGCGGIGSSPVWLRCGELWRRRGSALGRKALSGPSILDWVAVIRSRVGATLAVDLRTSAPD
jgi:hypothetical protein